MCVSLLRTRSASKGSGKSSSRGILPGEFGEGGLERFELLLQVFQGCLGAFQSAAAAHLFELQGGLERGVGAEMTGRRLEVVGHALDLGRVVGGDGAAQLTQPARIFLKEDINQVL